MSEAMNFAGNSQLTASLNNMFNYMIPNENIKSET